MSVDLLVENDQIICDLRDAIRDGNSGLRYLPLLLHRVLETGRGVSASTGLLGSRCRSGRC